mgnify:CR=1 FL=1
MLCILHVWMWKVCWFRNLGGICEESGIPELKKTTRDEPDYDKLMKWRLGVLKEHELGLKEIQETIEKIQPLPGAKEFFR